MQVLLYNLLVRLYTAGVKFVAPFNQKARAWLEGRKMVFDQLEKTLSGKTTPLIWMHCASLGEFEQGRPLIEKLKKIYPSHRVLVTFFSPSGYEIQKNYPLADLVTYLPVDTASHAAAFLEIARPELILFIKYDFWYHFLREAKRRSIPVLLVSAVFRKSQPFFKWYGTLHRKMLYCFAHLFVQDEKSVRLLQSINITTATLSGDTRFDRVTEIAGHFEPIAAIEKFCKNFPVIVAGSTWSEDDEELDHFANTHPEMRFIIAPHTIIPERLEECTKLYKHSMLYSQYQATNTNIQNAEINTLIIDNIGMLSRLYAYAKVCYVGGAFGGDGVHNVPEAAVYYKPVIYGPVFDKYFEASELIDAGGAFTVEGALELESVLNHLLSDNNFYQQAALAAGEYIRSRTGATGKITGYIQENRLLTS